MRPLAARRRGWIHRELSGEGSPRRSNEQLQALLAGGALGIDVIGDNPTMSALDPDHPMCVPAVGTTGVSLCRKQDFIELLEGIPLDEITLSHSLPPAFALAGQYLASPRHGIDPRVLIGGAERMSRDGQTQEQTNAGSNGAPSDEMGHFVSAILGSTEAE